MPADQESVLIVDDNSSDRELLRRFLTEHGLAVTEAVNGTEALALAHSRPFDVILLDVSLGEEGPSGLDVLADLRRKYPAVALPILMATVNDEPEDIVQALAAGANDYLTKPFHLSVVLARVRTQLALKRAHSELAAANRRMKQELQAAARVQKSLLPRTPNRLGSAAFAWKYRPCDELAGDLLNILPLDERRVCLYVLDVVGHGVKAALLAVMVSRVLGRLLSPSGLIRADAPEPPSPAEVAGRLNQEFPWDDQTQQFFTMMYGVLDLENGDFCYVGAGHPGPLHLVLDSGAALLDSPGDPIGLGGGPYEERRLSLRKGERLYLFSDGVIEAMNPKNQAFGKDRLCRLLEEGRQTDLSNSLERLSSALAEWCAPDSPHDDVSVLGVEML